MNCDYQIAPQFIIVSKKLQRGDTLADNIILKLIFVYKQEFISLQKRKLRNR